MNKRGQALVEFVLIIPIIILLIFAIFDFCKIYYEKMRLENIASDVVSILSDSDNFDDAEKKLQDKYNSLSLQIKYTDSDYIELKLVKNIDIITPGLNLVLSNPYEVSVTRYVNYEKDE